MSSYERTNGNRKEKFGLKNEFLVTACCHAKSSFYCSISILKGKKNMKNLYIANDVRHSSW